MTTINYSRPTSEREALDMVSKYPLQLKFLKGQTEEVALAAVKADWRALQYVEHQTPEMCLIAFQADKEARKLFRINVNPEQNSLSKEDQIAIVREDPGNIRNIVDPDLAVTLEALKNDGMTLRHIQNQTPEMQAVAIANNPLAIQYAIDPKPELSMLAAALNPEAGKLAPRHAEDKPKGEIMYTRDLPDQMAMDLVREKPYNLEFIKGQTPEIARAAVEADPMTLRFVENQTPELCQLAYELDPGSAAYINIDYTPSSTALDELKHAVAENPTSIAGMTEQSTAAVAEAVRNDGLALEYVKAQSPEISAIAVAQNPKALDFVKDKTAQLEELAQAIMENENAGQRHSDAGIGLKNPESENNKKDQGVIHDPDGMENSGSLGADGTGEPESAGNETGNNGRPGSRLEPDEYGERGAGQRTGDADARERPEQAGNPRAPWRGYQAGDSVIPTAPKERFKANLAAIKVLNQLGENGVATEEQLATLSRYTGWGGLTQAFDPANEKWAREYSALKRELPKDAYESARRSILDAYYTPESVIKGIYAGLERMGARHDEDAQILEPSAGTGRFMGFRPEGFGGDFTAIEPDPVSAAIARHLYPNARTLATGFEKAPLRGEYDIAIGNPPYGSTTLYDQNFSQYYGYSIHNYFMAKSIDMLREGGIAAFVVSSAFLDGKNPDARRGIAEKAEFLGAIRLPSGAFKGTGTDVLSDIVFFRKDTENPNKDMSWVDTVIRNVEDTNGEFDEVAINAWLDGHESQMLGRLKMVSGPHGWILSCAGDTANLHEKITAALAILPENIYAPFEHTEDNERTQAQKEFLDSSYFRNLKQGAYAVEPDSGKIIIKNGHDYSYRETTKAGIGRLAGMIGLRDTLRQLLNEERKIDAEPTEMDRLRQELNERYDSFRRQFGYLNSSTNRALFRDDPEAGTVQGLEKDYQKAIGKAESEKTGSPQRPESAQKADIFARRVLRPDVVAETAESAPDAMLITLSEKGRLDFDRMGELMGRDAESIRDELSLSGFVYRVPGTDDWETRTRYLSGNVKAKLAQAEEAAQSDPAFAANVAALKEVIPQDVEVDDIAVELGSVWVPARVYEEFARHILDQCSCTIRLNEATGTFMCSCTGHQRVANYQVYGIREYGADKLLEAVFHNTPISVFVKNYATGRKAFNPEKTALAKQKAEDIKQRFRDWIWMDEDRRKELSKIYNDRFNTIIPPKYDGQFMHIPGMSSNIHLRPHQKDAVWRFVQEGRGLMDHVMGAGKTMVAITTLMERKRMGLVSKPMVVVPNHLLYTWRDEFRRLYPDANILIAEKDDMKKENRRRFFGRVSTGDWDAVITTHSAFGKIPVPKKEAREMYQDQIDALRDAIDSTEEDSRLGARHIRRMETRIETLEAKMSRLSDGGTDDYGLDFADLGVDALFVDESQEFKNLGFATSMQVMGLGNQNGSNKAFDLFAKCRFIQNRHDGQGVFFMTGTPISNSMAEVYTLQRYMDLVSMRRMGISTFDAWASTFATVTEEPELDATGMNYALKSRMRSFNNIPELQALYRSFADVVTQEDLEERALADGLPRYVPYIEGDKPTPVICERSEDQARYMDYLVNRAEHVSSADPKEDNMLKITTEARKCGLDMRLLEPDANDFEGSKISVAARKIHDIWQSTADDLGTQLVFCDLSTPKGPTMKIRTEDCEDENPEKTMDEIVASRGSGLVYNELKARLVEMGIPEHEIAFIHDANTDARKAALYADMNEGRRRILIGSTSKMGAGMNVQKRLVAAHHLDAPWRPSDMEQRNGRIVRQGNMLFERDPEFRVKIFNYGTEKTYDARQWQTIEYKAKSIDQFRKGDIQSRKMEDLSMGSASAEEMKALASGNPLLPLEVKYKRQVLNYEADRANFMREQRNLRDQLKYLVGADARLADAEKAYAIDSQAREAGTEMKDGRIAHAIAWNGESLEGKKLESAVRGLYEKTRKDIDSLFPLGAYRGFNLFVKRSLNYGEDGFRIIMKGKSGTHYQPASLIFAKAKPLPDQDSHATDQINLFRRTPRGKEQEKKAAEDIRIDAKAIFARLDKAIDVKLDEGIIAARETAAKEKANADAVRGGIMDCYPKEKEYRVARANHAAIMVELEKMKSDKGYKPDWQPYTVDDNLPGTEPKLTVPNEYMRLALKGKLGLDKVPEEHRMPEFFMDAVRQSPINICAVPEEFQTIDICREAIRQNPLTLTYVNDQNEDVCMEAIRLDPRALAMVREQSHELQIKAVRENPRTLEYVCANGSLSGYGHNCNIHCWPEKIPPDVALEAVRQDGMTLEFVRTHTPEIDMAAVTQNGMALKFIEEQTDALIQAATRQNPEAEKYVLEECYSSISSHTSKISREAIRNTIRRLESGDERIEWTWHQTPEIALAAVKANGENLKRVVEALKTREVVEAALEQNIGYMAYAPAGFTMEKERNAMKERAGM